MLLHNVREFLLVRDWIAINGDDQITANRNGCVPQKSAFRPAAQAGSLRSAALHDLDDEQAGISSEAHLIGKIQPNWQSPHAQRGIAGMTEMYQVVQNSLGRIDGNGKADAGALLRSAGKDHGINTDNLAVRVEQRATGIPGIDGRIGLD